MLLSSLFSTLAFCLSTAHAASAFKKRVPNPCGEIVRNSSVITFSAALVFECLTSVPFDAAVAREFIQYYRDSVQFQSTLAYLKAPPRDYQRPPVDLLAELDRIRAQIDAGSFRNQYEFETTLQALIYSAHDDHLALTAGILGVFSFGTSYRIASVSVDGVELPKTYLTSDLILSQKDGTWTPSPITTLDGQEVTDYLSRFAARNAIGGRETHTDWNQLMVSPVEDIQGTPSLWGGGGTFYPGDVLTIKLENGTEITTKWYGVFHGESGIGPLETGEEFYDSFVLGFIPLREPKVLRPEQLEIPDPKPSSTTISSGTVASPTNTNAAPTRSSWQNPAYPTPDIAQEDLGTFGGGFVSGYFLRQSSVAVLSIPSFQEFGDAVDTYSATVGEFIAASKAAGMKKVVIDLQRNYGGDALLAFDTFKQFFPTVDPYAGSRMRASSPANVMGKTLTNYWKTLSKDRSDYFYLYANEWVASTRLDAETNQNFASWEQFFGPQQDNGDAFTNMQRYNLSDSLFDTLALEAYIEGFDVYGYGSRRTNASQPYSADDIILLTDGICSSTCSLFVEMMHGEAGVKTVVAGGRPSYDPMQVVGLSRGARSYGITQDLDPDIADTQTILNFSNLNSSFLPNRTEALEVVVYGSSINLRDQIRKDSSVPLQFTYDAADCRIFFTHATIFNMALLWQYAADAIWTNPKLCVKNSTGYARTKANSTTLPPPTVLAQSPLVEPPPPHLGTIIHNIFDPNSNRPGIEASRNPPRNGVKILVDPMIGANCGILPCDDGYFCYSEFTRCHPKFPSEPVTYFGCVKLCIRSARNSCGGGAVCRALREDPRFQLDNTGRGFCARDPETVRNICRTVGVQRSVRPGGGGKPGNRVRGVSLVSDVG